MRINSDYILRNIAGENLIVKQGKHGVDMTHIISFNSSATAIWEEFAPKADSVAKEFSAEDVANFLVNTYGITNEVAQKDANAWCAKMAECGVLEEN